MPEDVEPTLGVALADFPPPAGFRWLEVTHQPSLLDGEVLVTIRAERLLTRRTYKIAARVTPEQSTHLDLYKYMVGRAHDEWPEDY